MEKENNYMIPQAEIQILEEVREEVEYLDSVQEVVEYLNDRLIYVRDQIKLEETLANYSNEDIVHEEEKV